MLSTKDSLLIQGHKKAEISRWEKILHINSNQVAIKY